MIDSRPITAATNRQLHALLTVTNMMPHKADLVHTYSSERTEHSSELMEFEAINLIKYLRGLQTGQQPTPATNSSDKMRKKILAIAHTLAWYQRHADGKLVSNNGKQVLDMARINAFCTEKGPYKKPLQLHTEKELTVLVTVFEKL